MCPTAREILAVNDTFGASCVKVIISLCLISSDAHLVTDRPHNYARVVFVALKQSLYSVEEGFRPIFTVGNKVPEFHVGAAVALYISLVDNVKSKLVTKRHKARIVGIMAGSDRIDIVTLHNKKVFSHVVKRNGAAKYRMAVVTVNALCLDLLAVYKNHAVNYLYFSEAYVQSDIFTSAMNEKHVKIRYLVTPEKRRGNRYFHLTDRSAACHLSARRRDKAVFILQGGREHL